MIYTATHKKWKGFITLKDDGLFDGGNSKGTKGGGAWTLTDNILLLDWTFWGQTTLTLDTDGTFKSEELLLSPCEFNKVFNIGLHRTATRSFCKAMDILGINSHHYRYGRSVFNNFKNGDFSIISNGNSVCSYADIPIPFFYEDLDRVHPHSKFILTVRQPEIWLNSVNRHLKGLSPSQKRPLDREIHKYWYGIELDDFDNSNADHIRVSKYNTHNSKVRQYFKYRPNDLLIIDLTKENSWEGLCEFLDRDIPDVPFPKKGTK